ncbi:hypothetical protein HID58_027198, partial [Brassica napus]
SQALIRFFLSLERLKMKTKNKIVGEKRYHLQETFVFFVQRTSGYGSQESVRALGGMRCGCVHHLSCLQTLKESLHLDQPQDLSSNDSSLINVYHHQASSLLSYPSSSSENCVDDVSTTTTTMNHPQSKFSILLFNHENGAITQFANPSALPSFEQQPHIQCNQNYGTNYMDLLLGEQGCNNVDLLMPTLFPPPPMMMQTQTPNFEQFMQTQPAFGTMLS